MQGDGRWAEASIKVLLLLGLLGGWARVRRLLGDRGAELERRESDNKEL